MKTQQRHQARQLYLQSTLSVTDIATTVGVSRRSIQLWAREDNWDKLKESIQCIAEKLSESSGRLIAQYTDYLVADRRNDTAVSRHDIETLHKVVLAVTRMSKETIAQNITPAKILRKNSQLMR